MRKDSSEQLSFEDMSDYDIDGLNAEFNSLADESLPAEELRALDLSFTEENPFKNEGEESQGLNACHVFREGQLKYLITDGRTITYHPDGKIIDQRRNMGFRTELNNLVYRCAEEAKSMHSPEIRLKFYHSNE